MLRKCLLYFLAVGLYAELSGASYAEESLTKEYSEIRKKAEQGEAGAQFNLGRMYQLGLGGLKRNAEAAITWFRKAAEQGNAKAQIKLGAMYFRRKGGQAEAVKWWRKAAEQGEKKAQAVLGMMYKRGMGGLKKDAQAAIQWYRKAAEQGHANAQNNLGVMYSNGVGVKKDKKEAVKWYRKAVEQGHADAQFNLGFMYSKGVGVKKDKKEAVKWYRKAAEQGHAVGQNNLGFMYHYGYGVKENKKEAVKWYRKAAEQGFAEAQYNLGWMYSRGQGGLEQKEAVKWLRKAVEQGRADAQKRLTDIEKHQKRYQKIAANGNRLAYNARQWSCVADTQTGLMWEVKTNGGLHDKNKEYRWGGKGVSQIALAGTNNKREESRWNGKGIRYKDWNALVDGTNSEALCGHSDWRVPTLYELSSLVYCSNGAYDLDGDGGCIGKDYKRRYYDRPTINTAYFPNTQEAEYWSASPYTYLPSAWYIYFGFGSSHYLLRGYHVRLVRGEQ